MQNILVIDDTEDLRSVIATVLKSYGFSVREAQNGRMGVQMIAEEKPDLVICDVNMPAMGGYETLAAVRQSSRTATIPFILMTGLVSREGFRRGMVCGADDYLVKPFTPDELIEAVMSRLVRRRMYNWKPTNGRRNYTNMLPVIPSGIDGYVNDNVEPALASPAIGRRSSFNQPLARPTALCQPRFSSAAFDVSMVG